MDCLFFCRGGVSDHYLERINLSKGHSFFKGGLSFHCIFFRGILAVIRGS